MIGRRSRATKGASPIALVNPSTFVAAINGGSSSIKLAVYRVEEKLRLTLAVRVERIGLDDAFLRVTHGGSPEDEPVAIAAPDHATAMAALLAWLPTRVDLAGLVGAGHRLVHGGARHRAPERVTEAVLTSLQELRVVDTAHLPAELAMIDALRRCCADVPQVLCFDTAFHATMPREAQLLPIPRRYEAKGLRRYGFHGLSYEFLLRELGRVAGRAAAHGRVVLAHLGSGSSLAAVREGRCIDTSMSFTPTSGIAMSTRSGDLDPGVLLHLLRTEGLSIDEVDALVNRESGLLGVSETSPDMRDLLARRDHDPRCAEAVTLFCYQVRKQIGAYAAALGGLDTLVFAGGIGEHAAVVRREICAGLEFLGIVVDEQRNQADAAVISRDDATVFVRVMQTDEEIVIAESTCRVLGLGAGSVGG